jgi:hypothetical protein
VYAVVSPCQFLQHHICMILICVAYILQKAEAEKLERWRLPLCLSFRKTNQLTFYFADLLKKTSENKLHI